MRPQLIKRDRRAVTLWLCLCLLMVAMMVLVGGYTRLSGSGLSITTWKPIHGTMPPLNEQEWLDEFEAYKASPQYHKINSGMTMDEFRIIFWPEFLHRLLGRVVGMVFFLPLLFFTMRRSLSKHLTLRLAGIFALGGFQGLMGWLMVKSGLVDAPYVSPLRLAAHLSVAFTIFALILWTIMDIVFANRQLTHIKSKTANYYIVWFMLLCVQIVMGALMAGTHAGLIYNTWPKMDGDWMPPDMMVVSPWYANIALIQFIHRTLAIFLALGFGCLYFINRKYVTNIQPRIASNVVMVVLSVQFILGIITLLYQAPLSLSLAHQMTGLLLFASAVVLLHAVVGKAALTLPVNHAKPVANDA